MSAQPSHELPLDLAAALPAEEPAPTNRAARRGKAGKHHVSDQARYQPPAHARSAQGRRINPVRRNAG